MLALLAVGPVQALTVYRFHDDSGRWVFTDRPPEAARDFRRASGVATSVAVPRVRVASVTTSAGVELRASNEYLCPVELIVRVRSATNLTVGPGAALRVVMPPDATAVIARFGAVDPGLPATLDVARDFVPGDPDARHRPRRPYRPPFSAAAAWPVSQAWPDAATHDALASRHAVDIAMPEGTGILAARAGVVVAVIRNHFRGGDNRKAPGARANQVQILHDDGTFGLYAHLRWSSVRVRPGQRVARGEYIADSGNTGFSTGPHLHFAVLRNAGLRLVSEPVMFASAGGAIRPTTGVALRNP